MKNKVSRSRILTIVSTGVLLGIAITAGAFFSDSLLSMVAHAQSSGPIADCDECEILEFLDLGFEHTSVLRKRGRLMVVTEPRINSPQDLTAYKGNSRLRLMSLPPSAGTERKAAVTFTAPLTLNEVEDLLSNVTIHRLRYVSHPRGGGKVSYPLPTDNVQHLETAITEDMREREGIRDFRLIDGFVAAEVQGHVVGLQSLQNDARVFLVDVGAVEFLDQYPGASIRVDDISYRYNKFSRQ